MQFLNDGSFRSIEVGPSARRLRGGYWSRAGAPRTGGPVGVAPQGLEETLAGSVATWIAGQRAGRFRAAAAAEAQVGPLARLRRMARKRKTRRG
jgi:hypothetical protein